MYRAHDVTIRAKYREVADAILVKHNDDIDDIAITAQRNCYGEPMVTYWIAPYIYEDFENIVNEFREAGIL